jgi:para-aminobenzoate synthetase component II
VILLIDNYDSFVFNLSRYLEELGQEVIVARNNKITIAEINTLQPSHIIISPGPCSPKESGLSIEIVREFFGKIPILGVCLGHQVIGHVFGGDIIKAKKPMHGKSCLIHHEKKGVFSNIESPLRVGRYHSLIVCEKHLSKELNITSRSPEGEIMSFSSEKLKLVGFQFHPESILTESGHGLLNNFINEIM